MCAGDRIEENQRHTHKKKTGTAEPGLVRFVRASRRTAQASACYGTKELHETKMPSGPAEAKIPRGKIKQQG
jgi:hypothetical protein